MSKASWFFIVVVVAILAVVAILNLTDPPKQEDRLPSIAEVQEFLAIEGYYKGKIDGLVGPLMQAAWDRYICDQNAAPHFEGNK